MTDVVVNKIQSIQRCVERAREIHRKNAQDFLENYDAQDAAVLNVVRACELSIDLSNHLIRRYKMGLPTSSAESFDLLAGKGVISPELSKRLRRMASFRNICVHQYRKIDYTIVANVIENDLNDLIRLGDSAMEYGRAHPL